MAAVQSYLSLAGRDGGFGGGGGGGGGGRVGSDEFPAGLRVLVVDDDRTCLRILEKMLRKCLYEVTMCSRAAEALSLLREKKGSFDVVISDVHMPDMDGFKLLAHVGLEMDLPVIMMSGDGRTSAVMKGIKHGACDYLIKPVRVEELQNIWQHVIRKRRNENKENDYSGSGEDSDRNQKRTGDETEYCSTVSEGTDGSNWKLIRKRKDSKDEDEDEDPENDDPSASKKPRVVWSVELHQQFVNAVNQLGIDKAVPKRILELMNVPGLTRENVASHLQKFRLYLKRISVAQHQAGMPSSFCGSVDSSQKLSPMGRLDFQALTGSVQIPPQTLSALQSEFGRSKGSLVIPGMDPSILLSSTVQSPKCLSQESATLIKCQTAMNKKYSQPFDDMSSGFTPWLPSHLGSLGMSGNLGAVIPPDSKMLVQMLHPRQQQHQSGLPESTHIINVQPSCLVVPSQVQNLFQSGNKGGLIDQTSYNVNSLVDYDPLTQANNISTAAGSASGRNLGVLTGYSLPTSNSSAALLSGTVSCEKQMAWQVPNSSTTANVGNRLPEFGPNLSEFSKYHDASVSEQILGRNLGFVGKQTSIPSRYAVDEMETFVADMTNRKNYVDGLIHYNMVKQELNMDIAETGKGGLPGVRYSPSDLMGVLSK